MNVVDCCQVKIWRVGCGAVRRDGGCLALRSRPAGDGFKPPASALAEDRCGERRGKRRDL